MHSFTLFKVHLSRRIQGDVEGPKDKIQNLIQDENEKIILFL